MEAKILKSEYKRPWDGPNGKTYYHDVVLEGQGDKPWNIGSQEQNPSFLAVGEVLTFEIKDAAKRSIKRVKPMQTNGSGLGGSSNFSDNSLGQQIGNALNVTAMLIAHGKIDVKELESTARRVVEISTKLKEEFSKPKTA